jgi:hypothetical protein
VGAHACQLASPAPPPHTHTHWLPTFLPALRDNILSWGANSTFCSVAPLPPSSASPQHAAQGEADGAGGGAQRGHPAAGVCGRVCGGAAHVPHLQPPERKPQLLGGLRTGGHTAPGGGGARGHGGACLQ